MNYISNSFFVSACLVSLTACAPSIQQNKTGIIYLNNVVAQYASAEAALQTLIAKNKNVILDFFATWCGPCKKLSATLSKMSSEFTDVLVIKIDGGTFRALLSKYGVHAYPTLFFYKNGARVHKHAGGPSATQLRSLINQHLR